MAGGGHQPDRAEPNLTPILDMVFQLITFFMLVVNFKAASLDLNLQLPVIGSALPSESTDPEVLVLNIDKQGRLIVYGEEQNIDAYIAQQAQTALRMLRISDPEAEPGSVLPATVVVRADKDTPFHLFNHVIKACQGYGYQKFQYRVMSAPPEA